MAKMDWLKLHHDVRTDPKLRTLTDWELRCWLNLLLYASEQNERGTIDLTDPDEVCLQVGITDEDDEPMHDELERVVARLVKKRLVTVDDEMLTFPAFSDRQYDKPSTTPEASRERKRRQRDRERDARDGEQCHTMSHPVTRDIEQCHTMSRDVTHREEKRREEEIREEKSEETRAREDVPEFGTPMPAGDLPPCLHDRMEVSEPSPYSGTCYGFIVRACEQQFGSTPSPAQLTRMKAAITDGCIPGCDGEHPQLCAAQIAYKLRTKGKTRFDTSTLWLKCVREDRMEVRNAS